MSTKTNFKRIALVAVAALGLGVLSSVPSQATVSGLTVTVTDGTAPTSTVTMLGNGIDSRTSARINITGTIDALDSITVRLVQLSQPTSGNSAMIMYYHDSSTPTQSGVIVETLTATNSTAALHGAAGNVISPVTNLVSGATAPTNDGAAMVRISTASGATTKYLNLNIGVQLDSATGTRQVGTYAYRAIVETWAPSATANVPTSTTTVAVNIVVAALASASTTPVGTYNFANLSSTSISAGATSVADEVISASATAGTTRGYLFVANRNAANGATTAQDSLTATVTGSGLVCTSAGTTCGKSIKVAATGDYQFLLQGDGTGGTSTITVVQSVAGNSYVKSLTYYAAAAKTLTASVLTPMLAIGSNDSAVAVTAVDGTGAAWGGTAYIVASAAADATAVGGSATTPVACVYRASNNTHYCPISAVAAGTGKFKVIDAATVALATATSNEVSVTSSAATAASLKISFSKASYAPNEVGYFVITALDAAGKATPAQTVTNGFASGGITSAGGLSMTTCSTLTSTTVTIAAVTSSTSVAGAQMCIFTAPVVGGTISLSAKGGSGLPVAGQVALTATATVTDNASAALAAVTALATTVASLKTLITTLTNLVLKIQKKVKA